MTALAGEGRVEKRFRVAREGQTVDGRELSRQEIIEIAQSYSLETYGARINVEHIAGWSPEPPFNGYGDITKAEAIEENGLMCLYNTISALPNFVAMNEKGQKIYPSIEFYRNFAGTGKAYQVGLGLTDTPASLGTEAIKFSVNKFALRTSPDKDIFMSEPKQQDDNKSFLQQMKELMTPQPKAPEKTELDDTVSKAVVFALNGIKDLAVQISQLKTDIDQKFAALPAVTPAPVAQTPVTTPATPENVPTGFTTQTPSNPMADLQQQVSDLQQQLQTLSTTPVNTPPPVAGQTGGATPY